MRSSCRVSSLFLILCALPWVVSANPPPPNDDFANAIELIGFPVSVAGTTVGATVEPGEPPPWWGQNEGSVWYRWTAPHTGRLRMVAEGCGLIPSLWLGDSFETLTHVYDKWDGTGERNDPASRYFPVAEGVAYFISVNPNHYGGGDFVLTLHDEPPTISGRVTGPDGETPLAGVSVWMMQECPAENCWEIALTVETDAHGEYEVRVAPGTYRVWFRIPPLSPIVGLAQQVYPGAIHLPLGADITVGPGLNAEGIDAILGPLPRLSGRVTGPDGQTGLANMTVTAAGWGNGLCNAGRFESGPARWHDPSFETMTDEDGHYEFTDIDAGIYRVYAMDTYYGSYAVAVYENTTSFSLGTDLILASGAVVEGVDLVMGLAGQISGRVTDVDGVTPLSGVGVNAFVFEPDLNLMPSDSGWHPFVYTSTDMNGRYTLHGLAAGTYRVNFAYRPSQSGPWVVEVFDNALTVEAGTDVIVETGKNTVGVNAVLGVHEPDVPAEFIGAASGEGNTLNLQFVGMPGRDYLLRLAHDPYDEWLNAGEPIACMPGTNSVTVEASRTTTLFQLRRLPLGN